MILTDEGYRYILTLDDYPKRYQEAVALPSIETKGSGRID